MTLFLFTFFLIYASIHLYAYLKIKAACAFGITPSIFLITFMVVMVFAPIVIRLSEKQGLEFFARLMSYAGYTWMGLLFLFTSASLVIDIYHFLIYLSGLILRKDLIAFIPSSRISFFIPLILSILIAIYGSFEAKNIRTERIMIRSLKIPESIGRLRIVQISDVHLGLIVRKERLEKILKEVKAAEPDLLVSTGDLVDGQINGLPGLAELLRDINPRYGKFAITGNHEFYAGLKQAMDFTEKAGFTILRGEGLTIAGLFNIAGVDDPAGKNYGLFREVEEKELLSGLPTGKFTLFLKHRPLLDRNAIGLFDLQLSGHTHKGQIFPFSLITKLSYPADSGYLSLQNNSSLYVSRGSGTWGPPIRFLSPPEVTVIEILPITPNF
ncbi:MAG TPA: metallophosphoesterase [Thermodesulfovibrionales bacterium]|nr:metallophosphoesterase [Thermodesulfovibrionales bacterium]